MRWNTNGTVTHGSGLDPPDPVTLAGLTQFSYDGRDQLLSVRAPNNATTSYSVDGLGNVTQESSPDRGSLTYTHDAAGNVRTRTDARGITATFTYDALNRLTGISYPTAGENVAFTYDSAAGSPACTNGIGRLCQVVDQGGTTRHAYDPRGNLLTVTRTELGQTYTTSYTYTGADRIASVTTPTGKTFTISRDVVGRVAGIAGQVAGAAVNFSSSIAYDGAGQVTGETFGNGVRETTTIDADGREAAAAVSGGGPGGDQDIPLPPWAWVLLGLSLLTLIAKEQRRQQLLKAARHLGSDSGRKLLTFLLLALLGTSFTLTPLTAYAFDTARSYDANNNLISRTNAAGTTTFTYDKLNRLSGEAGPARTQSFTYDPNGNRLTDGAGSYAVNPNTNRYTTIRSATATYDAAGNLTGGISTGAPPIPKSFTYNQAGRLSEVRTGATLLASYTYNAAGQRTRKALTAAGAQLLGLPATALTVVYHYDLAGNLLAETTSTATPIRTYVWREAGSMVGDMTDDLLHTPIAQIEHPNSQTLGGSNPTATETATIIICDALRTPRSASNAAGQEVWRWASDAFGGTTPNEDIDGNGQRIIINLRFPGQYADIEAGLHYNWNRTYDPASGRYLESDPIGTDGGINSYAYANLNPVRLVDPTGLIARLCATAGRPECTKAKLKEIFACQKKCLTRLEGELGRCPQLRVRQLVLTCVAKAYTGYAICWARCTSKYPECADLIFGDE